MAADFDGAAAVECLSEAMYSLISELDADTRSFLAAAADAGERPVVFPQPDGSLVLMFGGVRLGVAVLSVE